MPGDADNLETLLAAALDERRQTLLLRQVRTLKPIDATHVEIDGVQYVNFSSNNYLGLTHHPRVIAAMAEATSQAGAGAGASPLIAGHTHRHASTESALAAWKGTEAAVLLPSGYQASHAAVQTLTAVAEARGRPVRFLLDRLAHASLIDAIRASGAALRVFGHNDLAKLARLLQGAESGQLQVVATESIFSMDGDVAPLEALAELKRRHGFVLLLDEAHGSGVYGENGSGVAAEMKLSSAIDIFIVTLSKAMGSSGGAVCASRRFCDALANFGRAYIYSTAVAPCIAAACEAAIAVMRDEPQRQQRVRELAARVRKAFALAGDSPIVPIVLGEPSAALAAADQLREEGLLVLPVRPPTVPRGTSRLRVTVCSEHTDDEVGHLIEQLRRCRKN